MRNMFGKVVSKLMSEEKDVYFVCADSGNSIVARHADLYPDRLIDGGIAEQSVAGIAAGIASEGNRVIVYSIGNFPTMRCLEQIRNDAAYHNLNVKFCAVGGGLAYGPAGVTHHASEDFSIMCSIPNLTVFTPGDPMEVEACTYLMMDTEGPAYMRVGYHGEPNVHSEPIVNLQIGQALCHRTGDTVAIFTAGSCLEEGLKACNSLNSEGISTALYSFPTIKPIDESTIESIAWSAKLIVTLEENYIWSGFGSIVACVLASLEHPHAVLRRIALCGFPSEVGSREYLKHYYHIDCKSVVDTVKVFLGLY